MPVGPAPTTVTADAAPTTGRNRLACSRLPIGYANSAAPGTCGSAPATSHGVDQVLVPNRATGRQPHLAPGRIDPGHRVDHQPDALGQDFWPVDDRVGGPADQLVQADPFDEGRAGG